MFKNILLLIVVAIAANSGGCSTTPTTTTPPTPVTKVTESSEPSFLQELALANPHLLEEQAGDQMVSDWRLEKKLLLDYPHGWSREGDEGIVRFEKWKKAFKEKYQLD